MIQQNPIMAAGPRLLTLTAAACLTASNASAELVPPNTPFDPGIALAAGTTIAATGSLSGTVLADQTTPFAEPNGAYYTGLLRSLVVRRADTSQLDFYFQLVNNTATELFPNDADIFGIAIDNFGGWGFASDALDMLYRTDGLTGLTGAGAFVPGTIAPLSVNREPAAPGSAGFVFATDPGMFIDDPTNLAKDEASRFLVIRTSATDYAASNALVLGTFGTTMPASFRPVPEPGAIGLLALGALGLGFRRRRAAH